VSIERRPVRRTNIAGLAAVADLDAHLDAPHLRDFAARIPELLDDDGLSVHRVRRIA